MGEMIKWGEGPKTFEEYENEAMESARSYAKTADLKKILKELGVRGWSKMSRSELLAAVEKSAEASEEFERMVREGCRHYRWVVARGVAGCYEELSDIEREAGVVPDMNGASCGIYRSWDDVRKVYAAAAAHDGAGRAYASLRISASDASAADAVVAALESAGAVCTETYRSDWEGGLHARYFDVSVERPKA